MFFRNLARLLSVTVLTFMLSSCYSGARSENMVVGTIPNADFGKFRHNIRISATQNSTRWDSRVSEKNFGEALHNSLYFNDLLNDNDPEYELTANIIQLTPPSMDFDMHVTTAIQYIIRDIDHDKIVVDKTIESRSAASQRDEPMLTDRKRVVNERAINQNLQDFVNYLRR